jgi:hypothetical protein
MMTLPVMTDDIERSPYALGRHREKRQKDADFLEKF